MPRCILHPGRVSVASEFGNDYCAQCRDGIVAARADVDRHVEPKDCFVWYASNDNWQPITGTGCAHWVSHQLGIRRSGPKCAAGYPYRVRDVISGRTEITDLANVRVDDIYVTPAKDHMGLVCRLVSAPRPGVPPTIVIRHDSSRQGRVAENEFANYFHGHGNFYR